MKVSELQGAQLDYWVAKAEGFTFKSSVNRPGMQRVFNKDHNWIGVIPADDDESGILAVIYSPSTDWSQGGLIIEREKITSIYVDGDDPDPIEDGPWSCGVAQAEIGYTGPTLLIAAMRCFVASKFGEEVTGEGKS